MIQTKDLKRRRLRDGTKYGNKNQMFVAYKVEITNSPNVVAQNQPLILNTNEIYNFKSLTNVNNVCVNGNANGANGDVDYVRGEILGFCEVSLIPFGLGNPNINPTPTTNFYNNDDPSQTSSVTPPRVRRGNVLERPVLTNLSVKKEARTSGVGSKLLQACENVAKHEWKQTEIVLEVEDDNVSGLQFYLKRGYKILFADPASRRYNVDGFILKKVRCTRQILRKSLIGTTNTFNQRSSSSGNTNNAGINFLQRLRENMLQLSG